MAACGSNRASYLALFPRLAGSFRRLNQSAKVRTVRHDSSVTVTKHRATTDTLAPSWWTPFVWLLFALQAAQALWAKWEISYFSQSYWVINYGDGFVRRGLGGEVLRQVFGEPVPMSVINVVAASTTLIPLVAIAAVVAALLRAETTASTSLAAIIAASPFVVDQLIAQRRPDQLGLAVLVAFGFTLMVAPRRVLWAVVFGAVFGLASLVHEGTFMYQAAFAALLALALISGRDGWIAGTVVALPSAVAVLVSGTLGAASEQQIAHLTSSAPTELQPRLDHFMGYMGDSISDSVHGVFELGAISMGAMLAVGGILTGITVYLVRRWVTADLFSALNRQGSVALAAGIIGTVAVVGLSLLTGRDWIRWASVFGTSWLICTSFVVLAVAPREAREVRPVRALILVALVALPTLPAIWAG